MNQDSILVDSRVDCLDQDSILVESRMDCLNLNFEDHNYFHKTLVHQNLDCFEDILEDCRLILCYILVDQDDEQ